MNNVKCLYSGVDEAEMITMNRSQKVGICWFQSSEQTRLHNEVEYCIGVDTALLVIETF